MRLLQFLLSASLLAATIQVVVGKDFVESYDEPLYADYSRLQSADRESRIFSSLLSKDSMIQTLLGKLCSMNAKAREKSEKAAEMR